MDSLDEQEYLANWQHRGYSPEVFRAWRRVSLEGTSRLPEQGWTPHYLGDIHGTSRSGALIEALGFLSRVDPELYSHAHGPWVLEAAFADDWWDFARGDPLVAVDWARWGFDPVVATAYRRRVVASWSAYRMQVHAGVPIHRLLNRFPRVKLSGAYGPMPVYALQQLGWFQGALDRGCPFEVVAYLLAGRHQGAREWWTSIRGLKETEVSLIHRGVVQLGRLLDPEGYSTARAMLQYGELLYDWENWRLPEVVDLLGLLTKPGQLDLLRHWFTVVDGIGRGLPDVTQFVLDETPVDWAEAWMRAG